MHRIWPLQSRQRSFDGCFGYPLRRLASKWLQAERRLAGWIVLQKQRNQVQTGRLECCTTPSELHPGRAGGGARDIHGIHEPARAHVHLDRGREAQPEQGRQRGRARQRGSCLLLAPAPGYRCVTFVMYGRVCIILRDLALSGLRLSTRPSIGLFQVLCSFP